MPARQRQSSPSGLLPNCPRGFVPGVCPRASVGCLTASRSRQTRQRLSAQAKLFGGKPEALPPAARSPCHSAQAVPALRHGRRLGRVAIWCRLGETTLWTEAQATGKRRLPRCHHLAPARRQTIVISQFALCNLCSLRRAAAAPPQATATAVACFVLPRNSFASAAACSRRQPLRLAVKQHRRAAHDEWQWWYPVGSGTKG
jgi:hypothetical protein